MTVFIERMDETTSFGEIIRIRNKHGFEGRRRGDKLYDG